VPELGSGVELSPWEVCRQILEGQQQMGVERGRRTPGADGAASIFGGP